MPAYIEMDITVKDKDAISSYAKEAPSTVVPFGGKFIIKGKPATVLEGTWTPSLLAIIEFPSYEEALGWYNSDAYAPLKALRRENANTSMIIIDGADEPAG